VKDPVNRVPNWKRSSHKCQLEVVVMKHDSIRLVIHLLLHEPIQSRSLQVIPDNMRLVLRLNAKIQVFSNVDVFLNYLWLVVLVCRDLNLKCA
jgi:hypothetical protein